jgi:hypothetical protein
MLLQGSSVLNCEIVEFSGLDGGPTTVMKQSTTKQEKRDILSQKKKQILGGLWIK